MGHWRRPIFADLVNASLVGWWRVVHEHLSASDRALFEKATGVAFSTLVNDDRWAGMRKPIMRRIMGIDKVVAHPLNDLGLHVLRALVSERITDKLRLARGSSRHPQYQRFMEDGILVLRNVENSSAALEGVFDSRHVERLLRMVSGFRKLEADSFTPWATHVHETADPQFYAHVDTYHPTWKIFVFQRTTINNGPLHYVRGSHRATVGKLRWLYNRTRALTSPRMTAVPPVNDATGPFSDASHGFHDSLRVVGFDPAVARYLPGESFGRFGFEPPSPVLAGEGMTLVVVDVSGIHFRGHAPPGAQRVGAIFAGKGGGCNGCIPRKNPFFCQTLTETC